MILNSTHRNMLISPARSIDAKVELYNGSALANTFNHDDALSSFTISRAGDKKFFGFGVCQEIELTLIDKERAITVEKDQNLKVSFIANKNTISPTPRFYITEVKRDENTNELTIKGYDVIDKARNHTVAELNLVAPYTILDVVSAIVKLLGISMSFDVINRDAFNIEYPEGANFDGAETLREVLDNIAEATQTIYYINNLNGLTFKHLKMDAEPVLTIRKDDYFTLESRTNRRLSAICSATELGDNVEASLSITGTTQYVRDNPFWELRSDITTLLDNALTLIGGLTINQFTCQWRGNYLVEPGDKIALTTKDNKTVISYMLDEKYVYNGGLSAETTWKYNDNEDETANNPSTLGDALKQTYAKVDKANKEITIVASGVESNSNEISKLNINTESIFASVKRIETNTEVAITDVNRNITELTSKVEATMTAEDVKLEIKTELETNGVDKITTATGFTFNEEGLTVEKSGSEMKTQITEDGMTVYRNDTAVLVADNVGVQATNLQANTYLIIGNNSRFEDYDNDSRTGCFWIGN